MFICSLSISLSLLCISALRLTFVHTVSASPLSIQCYTVSIRVLLSLFSTRKFNILTSFCREFHRFFFSGWTQLFNSNFIFLVFLFVLHWWLFIAHSKLHKSYRYVADGMSFKCKLFVNFAYFRESSIAAAFFWMFSWNSQLFKTLFLKRCD